MLKPNRVLLIVLAVFAATMAVAGAVVWQGGHSNSAAAQTVDFNRDIRPILNGSCIACHGGVKQAGGVSFSYREQALGTGKSGRPTVIPGNPRGSELMARVTTGNPETRMPLHAAPLPPEKIALLRQWIKEGAAWENYWAFVPPKVQSLPEVRQASWIRQPLDRFVLARLEKEKLKPSPEASKAALLRRVSLDLTGLPPTPEELTAFLADRTANAYEKQVDRLLASPRYGERWASLWLDLARYGDTKGFEKDRARPGAWVYRDWVIEALNKNLPYDRFVIKQLAGDLLPNSTLEDRIATAFHRQTPANDEGGTDNEEFRLAAVMDRASTTFSVLNGVSFNCVQCHSHPYDPIRNSEYYKFLAFFNTTRDADIAFDRSLAEDWPVLSIAKDKSRRGEAERIARQIDGLRNQLVSASRAAADASSWTMLPITQGSVSEVLAIERALALLEGKTGGKKGLLERLALARKQKPEASFRLQAGLAIKTGTVPTNSVFELTASTKPMTMTALRIEVPPADLARARHVPEKGFVTNRIDAWIVTLDGKEEKIAFRLLAPDSVENLEGDMGRLIRNSTGAATKGQAAARLAEFSGVMANPGLFRTRWVVAVPAAPQQLAPGARLRLQLTQNEPINAEASPPPRVRLLASSDARWTHLAAAPVTEETIAQLEILQRQLQAIPSVPLPVMVEQASYEKRQMHAFDRGSFLTQVGPALMPDTPAVFPALDAKAPRNRLTAAQWFFKPQQPLTARVTVNRYWEALFGTGIVETLEDFGSAGEMPSHPALLDWLALRFQNDLKWDTKKLLRELVTSATYRQDAATAPALQSRDPRNRLLARGPQQRLTAEMVRDQALQASGLLNPAVGGPPVMPAQPKDVWNVVANNPERWVDATGSDRYRRAVYTYIKRTALYPSFLTFDAADRQLSAPRRLPTNTPLQALVTLNDPVYQEAAQALAARMGREGGKTIPSQLDFGARAVLSRDLSATERDVLNKLYQKAGMTAVASALLNLDAALTR
jgi:mono/diheme cytochrome c family protein